MQNKTYTPPPIADSAPEYLDENDNQVTDMNGRVLRYEDILEKLKKYTNIPHAKLYVVGRTDLYPSQSRVIGSMTNPIDREKFKKKLWKLAVSKKDTSKNPPKK